jgi:hypothetical protein
MAHPENLSEFEDRNNRRIALLAFEAADVLLAETRDIGNPINYARATMFPLAAHDTSVTSFTNLRLSHSPSWPIANSS